MRQDRAGSLVDGVEERRAAAPKRFGLSDDAQGVTPRVGSITLIRRSPWTTSPVSQSSLEAVGK
jgi:hypothetical protein